MRKRLATSFRSSCAYLDKLTHANHAETIGAKEAGILKPVGAHTFRHCFATHLLQAGTDLRKIQELLGHKDLKTTMVHTHIVGMGAGVKSPLDSLDINYPVGRRREDS